MAASGAIDVGSGSYSFAIDGNMSTRKVFTTCRNHPLSAPKHDSNSNGATSAEAAIQKWCSDVDNHTVTKKSGDDVLYSRWGVTKLGVTDRSSFWLRVSVNSNSQEAKVAKDECITTLKQGLEQCDANRDETHGFTVTAGSLDYGLDLSGVTQDGNSPWNEKPGFPAPEFVPGKDLGGAAYEPICYPSNTDLVRKLSDSDLSNAINAFCMNGADIKGFGNYWENMFQYPPKGQPQFYNSDSLKMHLLRGAETISNGAKQPYDDMNWCK